MNFSSGTEEGTYRPDRPDESKDSDKDWLEGLTFMFDSETDNPKSERIGKTIG